MKIEIVLQSLLLYPLYYWYGSNYPLENLPRSLPLLDGMLSLNVFVGLRFSVQAAERGSQRHHKFHRRERVLIVGAGHAGVALVQEMQRSPQLGFQPVAFIDDDPKKLNLRICKLTVVGDRHKIPEVVRSLHIRRVIIAMPSVSRKVIREIVDICQSIRVLTSTLPGIHEVLINHVRVENNRHNNKIETLYYAANQYK